MNSIDVSPSDGFSHVYNSMNESISNANPLDLISLSAILIIYFIIKSQLMSSISSSYTSALTCAVRDSTSTCNTTESYH